MKNPCIYRLKIDLRLRQAETKHLQMGSSFSTPEVSLQGAAAVRVFVASHNVYHCHSATSSNSSSLSSAQATSYVYRKVMDADFKCSCISVTVEEIAAMSFVPVQESDPSVSQGKKTCEMAGLHRMNNVPSLH